MVQVVVPYEFLDKTCMSKNTISIRPYGPDFARAQAIASAEIEGFSLGEDPQDFYAWRRGEISNSEFRAREIAKLTALGIIDKVSHQPGC